MKVFSTETLPTTGSNNAPEYVCSRMSLDEMVLELVDTRKAFEVDTRTPDRWARESR